MSQQSAICSQLHGPTGVTHCASAFLTHTCEDPEAGSGHAAGAGMPNLVIARSTALDVYAIRLVGSDWRLAVCGRFPLFGVVESLAVLKGCPGQRDALLLTFREAKLSVLYWDGEQCELVSSGLHYFEGDPALKAGRTIFPMPPLAVADPEGRCAAVVMFRHQLAVLPTMREESDALTLLGLPQAEPGNGAIASGRPGQAAALAATLGNSYLDNLAKAGIKEVRDAVFLHGYSEPVLLLLHEDDPTWAGNLRTKKDTCCLTALSLNLSMKRHPRIWATQHLPFDAYCLIAVPTGGALVLCTHMVLFFTQGHQTGVVVNSVALGSSIAPPALQFELMSEHPSASAAKYARQYACSTHPDTVASAVQYCDTESAAGMGLELDGAHGTWLGGPTGEAKGEAAGSAPADGPVLLLALRGGQLVLVRLVVEGGSVCRLQVSKAGTAPSCACITTLAFDMFFLGSHQGDSLLVRATPAAPAVAALLSAAGAAPAAAAAVPPTAAAAAGNLAAVPLSTTAAAVPIAPAFQEPTEAASSGRAADSISAQPRPTAATPDAAGTSPDVHAAGDSGSEQPSTKRRRLDQGDPQQEGRNGCPQQQSASSSAAEGRVRGAAGQSGAAHPAPLDVCVDAGAMAAGKGVAAAQEGETEGRPDAKHGDRAGSASGEGMPAGKEGQAAAANAIDIEEGGTAGGEAALPTQEQGNAAAEGGVGRQEEDEDDGNVEEYVEEGAEVEEGEGDEEEEEEEELSTMHADDNCSDSDEEALLIYGEAMDGPGGAVEGDASGTAATAGGGAVGRAATAGVGVRYNLKIVDSLVNIGPLRDMSVGGLGSPDYPPFLVTCGGRERGGALCMLRQHVMPEVITDVPLQGVVGVWAVHHRAEGVGMGEAEGYHSYLLISFPGSTKVLATGEELQEVTDSVEFAMDTTTIAAGSTCGGRRIIQVFPEGVRIMNGGEMSQEFWAAQLLGAQQGSAAAPANTSISSAAILDPYVLVRLSDGTCALLEADPATGDLAVVEHGAHVLTEAGTAGPITACCLHQDTAGMLATHYQRLQSLQPAGLGHVLGEGAEAASPPQQGQDAGSMAMYCTLFRADGRLEVYSLPAWQQVFQCRNLGEGPTLLDHGSTAPTDSLDGISPARIVEVRLECFGVVAPDGRGDQGPPAPSGPAGQGPSQLALVALTSEDSLLVYRAFTSPQGALKFRRLQLDLPPALPPVPAARSSPANMPRLTRFDGLGEDMPIWGICIAGASPALLVAARGTLLPHPLYVPAGLGVSSFTPFHNINCPYGFITACVGEGRGSLQICQPPPRTRLDCPWPRTKIPLRATPLRITHYPEADLFAVLAARQVPYRPFLPEEEGGEPHASFAYALADAAAKAKGTMDGHEVRLVDPENWTTVWRYSLLPGERALTVKAVHLRDTTTRATVPLLAVGAGFVAGEDYPCLGRVLLFRVHKAASSTAATVAEAGSQAEWSATLVYSRDFRGPVSAVACLEGYLLLSAGNRIETLMLSTTSPVQAPAPDRVEASQPADQQPMYKFHRASFYDGPMLVTTLNVVKNFVLLGDAQNSVQFVRYKDEGRQLALLSKDFSRANITATEFLINGASLHMACGDGDGVLRLLSYSPNHPGSWRGQKLVPWGAFQLGDAPLCMLRVQLQQADAKDKTVRQAVLCGDGAGAIGVVAPLVHAQSAAVLVGVQRELTTTLHHTAGLNPASFRMQHARLSQGVRGSRWFGQPLPDLGVLDGELLMQYCHLPRREQTRVAKAAGSTREAVMALLADTISTMLVF